MRQIRKNKFAIFGLMFMLFLLLSCGKSAIYSKSYSFEDGKWKQNVKPVFQIDIPDTEHAYTLTLSLRVTTDYAFNNLWMFFHSVTPNGETGREPIEVRIVSPDGAWLGEKSGSLVEVKVAFKNRKFPQKGKYTFTLEQGITEEEVRNISDISLTLEKAQAE